MRLLYENESKSRTRRQSLSCLETHTVIFLLSLYCWFSGLQLWVEHFIRFILSLIRTALNFLGTYLYVFVADVFCLRCSLAVSFTLRERGGVFCCVLLAPLWLQHVSAALTLVRLYSQGFKLMHLCYGNTAVIGRRTAEAVHGPGLINNIKNKIWQWQIAAVIEKKYITH